MEITSPFRHSRKPDWLTLTDNNDGTATLSGTPLNADVGSSNVVLNVADAQGDNVNQNFTITVANTNDAPAFSSTPITAAIQDIEYTYDISTSDVDAGDSRTITATVLPAWLSLTDNGNGTATLSGTPSNTDLGINNVTLNVEDVAGAAVDQVFTINVDNANDPPGFTSSPVLLATEDQGYLYNITTTDPDIGDNLTISALSKPGWLTLTDNNDGTATLSGTPLNADVGSSNVVLNVADAQGDNVNQNFTITVANTNDAPVFSSTPITVAIQDIAYNYNIETSDPDVGDGLIITATTLPAWLTFVDNGNGTASLSGTPTNTDLGSNEVTLNVEDVAGAAVDQVFTINVDNANDPPSFTSTPNTTATEDALYEYSITTMDPDVGDLITISGLTLPSWSTLTDNGDGTATLSGIPLNEDVGSNSVVINVADAAGSNINQNFTISVSNTNDAPSFTSTPITVAIQDISYNYAIETDDPDLGDIRTITASSLPGWLNFTDNGDGTATLSGTPTNSDLGINNVTLRVEDTPGAAVEQIFSINVNNTNDPPVFTSNPIQNATEDVLYTYNITSFDPDNEDSRSFSSLDLPDWLTLTDNGDGTGSLTGTPLNEDIGIEVISLELTDALGATDLQNFSITIINSNDAPNFSSTPVTIALQDIPYNYAITTEDPDVGDAGAISAIVLPSWLAFTDNGDGTASLSGTPTNSDLGSNNVTLSVSDLAGAAVEQNFVINVDNANDPPVITSNPVLNGTEDINYTYNITTSDPDIGDVLTISGLTVPSWLTLTDNGNGTASLSGTPLNDNVGNSNVVLNVSDAAGANINQNFTISVVNTNDAPSFTSPPNEIAIQDINLYI